MSRAIAGGLAWQAGVAAEHAVIDRYARDGHAIIARRWRGGGGEIDVVARGPGGIVFIEVKKSRDFASAAARLGQRQIARIFDAAAAFLAGECLGLDTPVRFDVALVDGRGMIEVIENALGP